MRPSVASVSGSKASRAGTDLVPMASSTLWIACTAALWLKTTAQSMSYVVDLAIMVVIRRCLVKFRLRTWAV